MQVGSIKYTLLSVLLALMLSCVHREDNYSSVRVFYLPVEISTTNNMDCERILGLKGYLLDTILYNKNFIRNIQKHIESTNTFNENDSKDIRLKVYLKKGCQYDTLCVSTGYDMYFNGNYIGKNEQIFNLLTSLFLIKKDP